MYTMKVNSGFSTEYWKTLTLWNLATLRIWLGAHEHDWNEIPRNRREETKPIRYNNKKKTRFAVVLFDLFNKWNGNDTPKQTRCFFFLYEESARVYWTIVVCVCATTLAWQSFFFGHSQNGVIITMELWRIFILYGPIFDQCTRHFYSDGI